VGHRRDEGAQVGSAAQGGFAQLRAGCITGCVTGCIAGQAYAPFAGQCTRRAPAHQDKVARHDPRLLAQGHHHALVGCTGRTRHTPGVPSFVGRCQRLARDRAARRLDARQHPRRDLQRVEGAAVHPRLQAQLQPAPHVARGRPRGLTTAHERRVPGLPALAHRVAGVEVVGAGHQAVAGVVAPDGAARGVEGVSRLRAAAARRALGRYRGLGTPARLQAEGQLGE
jgi:hypothetical protein